jgi:hypothetical protein
VFERRAGLADGGYTDKPLRPRLRALTTGQRTLGKHARTGLAGRG